MAASLDAFQELKDGSILVYASSNRKDNEWTLLPLIVRKAINDPASGRYIPKTVLVDTAVTRVLATIPYVRDPAQRIDALEGALKKLSGKVGSE